MTGLELRTLLLLPFLVASAASALAQHAPVNDRMLDSVVFVACDVELQGDPVQAGSGSGFLIAHSEYVITNHHVVDACLPDRGLEVLKTIVRKAIRQDIEKGGKWREQLLAELKNNPPLAQKISGDPALINQFVDRWVERAATAVARDKSPGIRQKLYVVTMGKSGTDAEPVRTEVSAVVWDALAYEKARSTGVDVAILKLVRPLSDRSTVNFATGSSARVNDQVYAVGFPAASGDFVQSKRYVPTMKRGIISKLGGESPFVTREASARGWKGAPVIEIDAAINHGNSGGPLYNQFGEVLGINTLGTEAAFGWAIDIDVVVPILQDLGLPLPDIRRTPAGWADEHRTAAWAGAGVLGLALLGVIAVFVRRRPKPASSTATATAIAPAAAQRSAGMHAGPAGVAPAAPRPMAPTRISSSAASLIGRGGQFKGVTIPLPPGGMTLGREVGGADRLAFAETSDLSRRHCSISYSEGSGRFQVTDHGSSNGTFMPPDGNRLAAHKAVECRPGQMLRLGQDNLFELGLR